MRETRFCSLLHKSQPPVAGNPKINMETPLMDLSSLEGPPVVNPRLDIPQDPTIIRVQEEPPTPQSAADARHFILSKPLPSRPASADPCPSRQPNLRPENTRLNTSAGISHVDCHLRRAPARRGRQNSVDDMLFDEAPGEAHPRPSDYFISASHEPQLWRSRSCSPLIWVEEEGMWVVADSPPSETISQTSTSRPSLRLHTWMTRPWERQSHRSDHDPPPYDSHAFRPPAMRRGNGVMSRWTAVGRRMHNTLSAG
ncbi:uncharacterized protein N7459_002800 [Penicillium hispanicum]|uniref:uncharacterized protein n=1 Tax=Penicillium hispanicum TaxID=1080232 RepID=UPI0025411258|nr:uncharacterized protein N7459_002800 [Penicillium hispanicum]KAJ5587035.1 hypothetical protein N7459_002800 [Penicillium hispanicum]